jgi:acetolactate synthase I/II/III large subunit
MTAGKKSKLYEVLAAAFVAEGIDTQFALMGDGNMHWSTALAALPGMQTIHVRHEHSALSAAMSYHVATGRIAAVSVTCGPGLTQLMTALPAAERARIPVVILAGETPINAKFYNQAIDHAPFIAACGAHYIQAHSLPRMLDHVREAFHSARHDRRPVVLGVPYDMQKLPFEQTAPYTSSASLVPFAGRPQPDPELVAALVEKLKAAKRPVFLGGRGVLRSGATEAIVALADRCGAVLANTLPVRGLFDHHTYGMGVAGGYGSTLLKEVFASADVVVAFGASLAYFTSDGGSLFPQATLAQVDEAPRGMKDGMVPPSLLIKADAKAAAEAITAALDRALGAGKPTAAVIRTKELAHRIANDPADDAKFEIAPGVIDPRAAIRALDQVIPKDWDIVSGSGHQAYFNASMRGRPPTRFTAIREFGAVGNGLPYALGVAAARRNNGKVVLIEGDGGFLMHIQELETLKRYGMRILICIMNDGAYGSEIHKLRADGVDDSGAIFGRPSFEAIAKGFGLRGAEVRDVRQFADLFQAFERQPDAELWNIQISDQVTAPSMRRLVAKGHGVM